MDYCYEKAIPHSVYLDTWSPEDRAKVAAYVLEKGTRCVSCGTAPWEWEENRFAYTPIEELCKGCYQKSVFAEENNRSLPGTQIRLMPTTPQLKAQMQVQAEKRSKMKME